MVPLIFPTSGPIETLFVMLQAMSAEALARRTISLDSTTLYFSDVLGAFRRVTALLKHALIICQLFRMLASFL